MRALYMMIAIGIVSCAVGVVGASYFQPVTLTDFVNDVADADVRHARIGYFSHGQVSTIRAAAGGGNFTMQNDDGGTGQRSMIISSAPFNADAGTIRSVHGLFLNPINQFVATAGSACGFHGLMITQADLNTDTTYQCCQIGNSLKWVLGVCHPDGGL